MLKIVQSAEGERIVFRLSGRVVAGHAGDLEAAFGAEKRRTVLDLDEVRLVDREVVGALARWESEGVCLRNCPAYVREWIDRERARG